VHYGIVGPVFVCFCCESFYAGDGAEVAGEAVVGRGAGGEGV